MIRDTYIILALTLLCGLGYPKEGDEIFQLGTTPFIYSGRFNLFITYGQNYGSPGLTIDEWSLPNHNRDLLFQNFKGGICLYDNLQLFLRLSKNETLWFGYSHLGVPMTLETKTFGIKWKFRKSQNWLPDLALKLEYMDMPSDLNYPVSLSIGSHGEYVQYYFNTDFSFAWYFIPLPNRYSMGLALSPLSYASIFGEFVSEPYYGLGPPDIRVMRYGIHLRPTKFIACDLSFFSFIFDFDDAIPSRDGLTWQDPTYIISVPNKESYTLFSWSMTILFSALR
ncbi:hypothetical protein ACFL5M_00265 [Candidatus Neomarinimicrobiota bacterium]